MAQLMALLTSVALEASAQLPRSAADSIAIVRAVWEVVVSGHAGRRAAALWSPSSTDTFSVVALSPVVRNALMQSGVPVSAHRPVGDDTVVVRVRSWRTEGGATLLEVESAWTTVLGSGARRCRAGSGNWELLRVTREARAWVAIREGPTMHGDRECAPIEVAGGRGKGRAEFG